MAGFVTHPNFMPKPFDYKIIEHYGKCIVGDKFYQKRRNLDECLYSNVEVALATGEIEEKDRKAFERAIFKYARLYLPLRKYELALYEKFSKSPEEVKRRGEEMDRIFGKRR
jgi:hypothetical protein